MPIDSDPDGADRARETLPPNERDTPERRGGPDVRADAEAPASGERTSRTADDVPQAAGFRQRQLAEHARYQRDVDAAYQADEARRTWAEAVPKLREAWAEHQEKHPERVRASPRTQPDGSWAAEGGRRLTPEQNAEATKACADLRDEADQVILPAMRRVEAASPHGRLAGLPHMLKGEDRLKEKIADELLAKPGKTVGVAMHDIADAVRFTLTYPAERYAEGVASDIDQLKAEGFELIKSKNLWAADQYKGINSQWRRPDTGTRIEMQFHTPESLEAKELTHASEFAARPRRPPSGMSLWGSSAELTLRSSPLPVPPTSTTSRRRTVADKITYYAIIDGSSNRDHPAGVLRRVENSEGDTDEVFSRNLKWEFSSLLYSAERGDLTNDFDEITEEEANRIVDRIRAQANDDV